MTILKCIMIVYVDLKNLKKTLFTTGLYLKKIDLLVLFVASAKCAIKKTYFRTNVIRENVF